MTEYVEWHSSFDTVLRGDDQDTLNNRDESDKVLAISNVNQW